MHTLTVGNDHIIDREFVEWDCLGSAAHIRMLAKLGILQNEEVTDLISALGDIFQEAKDRQVEIPPHLEDAHNYLENRLVERLGELGKKVHAGRSRNDQVLVTTRLHLRDALIKLLQRLHRSILILHAKHQEIGQVEFPGYTHMQPAMPSSLGMWLHSQMEGLLELIREGLSLYSSSEHQSFRSVGWLRFQHSTGQSLHIRAAGFARFHRSPIDGNNSRGRYESRLMHYCVTVADILEKARL
jgi:argininosuccinate lyase